MDWPNKNAMTCGQARELAGDRRAHHDSQFCEHIAACAECRELHEVLGAQHALLECWTAPEPASGTQARVMAGIARAERELREKESRRGLGGRIARVFFVPMIRVPAAAAVVLALVLLVSLGMNGLLLADRRNSQANSNDDQPAQTVAVIDGKVLQAIAPAFTPGGINPEQGGWTASRRFTPGTGTMPLGMIVILGVPPMTDPRTEAMADI